MYILLTAYQIGSNVNKELIFNLKTYANYLGAEIMVAPIGLTASDYNKEFTLPDELKGAAVITGRCMIGDMEFVNNGVTSQLVNPLAGLGRVTDPSRSIIVPSSKQHLIVQATNSKPKVLISSGCINTACYKKTRQGLIADMEHTQGFVFLHVSNKKVTTFRHVKECKNGFVDNGLRVKRGAITVVGASALVLGDIHVGSQDPVAIEAAYTLIRSHNPQNIIIHDLFDGMSINPHMKGKVITRSNLYKNLADELLDCCEFLQSIRRITKAKIYVVKSNHDEFLDRYLEAGCYDPSILPLVGKLIVEKTKGPKALDTLEAAMRTCGNVPKNVKFLTRDSSLEIRGYQLANHGDKGANGSRNTPSQIVMHSGASITGHSHTPFIKGKSYGVGTSTKLKLDYNKGPSSWMQSHAVLWKNGTVQLFNP